MNSTWWYGWGGYVVPDVYTDLYTELGAIRNGVAMNEMSPLPKMEIVGADAEACVERLFPRNISVMPVGRAWYAPCCNKEGKVVADGIIFRFDKNHFVFSADDCTTYFSEVAKPYEVEISNVTDKYGILALQGPRSRAVLDESTGGEWSDLRFGEIRRTEIAGVAVKVVRQGFTGELGFEIWVDRPDGEEVWEAVAASGANFGIQPAGEYAIDVARVEAGLLLISAEYTGSESGEPSADVPPNPIDHVTPYELNLGHCVKLEKQADFIGQAALAAELESGPKRRLVGLNFDAEKIAEISLKAGLSVDISPRVRWDHLNLRYDGGSVGRASSITWSPTSSKLIGFGLVPAELADSGIELCVDWVDYWGNPVGSAPVSTCPYPFIETKRR